MLRRKFLALLLASPLALVRRAEEKLVPIREALRLGPDRVFVGKLIQMDREVRKALGLPDRSENEYLADFKCLQEYIDNRLPFIRDHV